MKKNAGGADTADIAAERSILVKKKAAKELDDNPVENVTEVLKRSVEKEAEVLKKSVEKEAKVLESVEKVLEDNPVEKKVEVAEDKGKAEKKNPQYPFDWNVEDLRPKGKLCGAARIK